MLYKSAKERNKRMKKLASISESRTWKLCRGGAWFDEYRGHWKRYSYNVKGVRVAMNRSDRRQQKKITDEETANSSRGAYRKRQDYWWNIV